MKANGADLAPKVIDLLGGRTRTRTWDPLIKSQLLYQLSYAPEMPAAGGPTRAASCSKASSHCPAKPAGTCVNLLSGAQSSVHSRPRLREGKLQRESRPTLGPRFRGDERGENLEAPPIKNSDVIRLAERRHTFHIRTAEFHKRKAAGWGPGGSRTSAIVSGGWECDRR